MSLPHALLTSLLEKPSSGSELARRFNKSIGFFWQASHQQIYRELGKLELAGWVQSQADEGARGRKRSYAVLPAGREELVRWMAESSEPRNLRDEMMVRLRAAALLGPNGLAEDLRARLCSHQQQLELYKTIETRDFLGREGSQALKLQHLILQAGIQYEEMYVKFCADALNLLEAGVT